MTLIGPVSFKPGTPGTTEYGDFITSIELKTPEPVVIAAINKDYADLPSSGYSLTLNGVSQDMQASSLWRYLYDNAGKKAQAVTFSTTTTGPSVKFTGVIAVIPVPGHGGQANQHGTFSITIPLSGKPTITDIPAS